MIPQGGKALILTASANLQFAPRLSEKAELRVRIFLAALPFPSQSILQRFSLTLHELTTGPRGRATRVANEIVIRSFTRYRITLPAR